MTRILVLSALILISFPGISRDFNILSYGAKENSLSTHPVQEAIDACFEAGGGRVIIPSGKFIIGTIILKSNVNLHLESGATLEGSLDLDDYFTSFTEHGMIYCRDAENVSISGNGIIDARGSEFYEKNQNHVYEEFDKSLVRQKENYMPEGEFFTDGPLKRKPKPGMCVTLYNCSRVKFSDFLIKDTPNWAVRFAYCDDVSVRGISIYNNLMIPNSDGIHCTVSRNVRISDCNIIAGDDAIIVTSFPVETEIPGTNYVDLSEFSYGNKTGYAENVNVTNCQLKSRSSGIRVGYGQFPIRNCVFTNINIYESNRGIGVFAHDAADIENLIFSDITIQTRLHNGQWWGNGEPVHFSVVTRFEGEPCGHIRNVQFNNIIAKSEHGIILYGNEDARMENISFRNISLEIVNGNETLSYGGNFDLRPAADISKQLFSHDIPGFYASYIDELTIENFSLKWDKSLPDFFSHGIECHSVKGLSIHEFNGDAFPAFEGGQKIMLDNSELR